MSLLVEDKDRQEFKSFWPKLVGQILIDPDYKDIHESIQRLEKVMNYNVPHGKQNRGLTFLDAYRLFADKKDNKVLGQTQLVLAWCIEILQGSFLVADDIMDESKTKRGKLCWYQVNGVGLKAVNDTLMLEQVVYYLLRKYLLRKHYYSSVLNIFHEVSFRTTLGQCLDTTSCLNVNLDEFTSEKYAAIVKYKTSYYTFYMPVVLALTVAKKSVGREVMEDIENVLLRIGYLFQVQDDYLDCFGDPHMTGKIGTDIRDGKCTWLVLKALELASDAQFVTLKECYGRNDDECMALVKNIYLDLGIPSEYKRYEFEVYEEIVLLIKGRLPDQDLFLSMLNSIFGRVR